MTVHNTTLTVLNNVLQIWWKISKAVTEQWRWDFLLKETTEHWKWSKLTRCSTAFTRNHAKEVGIKQIYCNSKTTLFSKTQWTVYSERIDLFHNCRLLHGNEARMLFSQSILVSNYQSDMISFFAFFLLSIRVSF